MNDKKQVQRNPTNSMARKLYVNGFVTGATATETVVTFQFNGNDTVMLSMPFSVAKELSQKVGKTVANYEKVFGVQVDTVEDLTRRANPQLLDG